MVPDTIVYLPFKHDSTRNLVAVIANSDESGPSYSNSGTIFRPTNDEIGSDSGGDYFILPGDFTSETILVGYSYDFIVSLPHFYYRTGDDYATTDYTAYLTVSRLKFNFGLSGDISFTVKAGGRADWETTGGDVVANYYRLNDIPFTANSTFTLPIYQRSENFLVDVTSDSPFPVALSSLMWEGNYSPRFYTRK